MNRDDIRDALLTTGGWIIVSGPLIVLYQIYLWARYGRCSEIPLIATWHFLNLPLPETKWVGVQRILDFCFWQSTSLVISLSGLLLVVIGVALSSTSRDRRS